MNLELKCATFERMHQDYQNTIGKTIKIDGYYEVVDIEGTKYHLVTFMDPTGCCPYSMEWVPNTDELPKQGTNITIIGTFSTYTEEGSNNIYSHLIDTSFTLTN